MDRGVVAARLGSDPAHHDGRRAGAALHDRVRRRAAGGEFDHLDLGLGVDHCFYDQRVRGRGGDQRVRRPAGSRMTSTSLETICGHARP